MNKSYQKYYFKKIEIQAYKHNGELHRRWLYGQILEENEDYLVIINYQTKVIEKNGRSWRAKEPAIWYFFKNYWFNVISMVRSNGIHYYCNMASPYVIDSEGLKFIDYDLDLKVNNLNEMFVLDKCEFEFHAQIMNYPLELVNHLKQQLDELKQLFNKKNVLFSRTNTTKYYQQFLDKKNNKLF
ncbi:MAG: DUF402 domain-containing protein [Bacilli bacterium]|jgi:protein associated with RNAse G/E|nr:DUF402 domain-containing protein [Bacilli bacterium]